MPNKLSELALPEYTDNLERFEQYKKMYEGGQDLIDEMPELPHEDTDALDTRKRLALDMATHKDEIQRQINILTMSDLGQKVTNSDAINDLFTAENPVGVDGRGSNIISFMLNKVLRCALKYGYCDVVVDRTLFPDGDLSVDEAEELPEPYAYVVDPINRPCWSYKNQFSRSFDKILIKSMENRIGDLGLPVGVEPFYTLWTEEFLRKENQAGDIIWERSNSIGQVTIETFDLGESLMNNLWEPTLAMLQHMSLASVAGATQVSSTMVIFSDTDIQGIDVGYGKGVQLGRDDKIQNFSSSVEGAKFNEEFALKIKQFIKEKMKRTAGTMTMQGLHNPASWTESLWVEIKNPWFLIK